MRCLFVVCAISLDLRLFSRDLRGCASPLLFGFLERSACSRARRSARDAAMVAPLLCLQSTMQATVHTRELGDSLFPCDDCLKNMVANLKVVI